MTGNKDCGNRLADLYGSDFVSIEYDGNTLRKARGGRGAYDVAGKGNRLVGFGGWGRFRIVLLAKWLAN